LNEPLADPMAERQFLNSFLQGGPPREIRLAAACGLVPLAPDEMLELLVHLTRDPDPEIAAQALQTLGGWTDEEILPLVRAQICSLTIIEYFANASSSAPILEAIILNPSTQGTLIEPLAIELSGPLLEMILYNRIRLLECPAILANVKQNPNVTPEVARLVQEVEVEFFGGKKTDYRVGVAAEAELDASAVKASAVEATLEDFSLEGLPLDPDEREAVLSERISRMTVLQKTQHALLGNREARAILVRDPNRQVARSVLQSPKLSDTEIETFAAMRNVSDEILREIGNNRAWIRSYPVVRNLAHNPKTPPAISQRLLSRLLYKDLANLARDRSVPEAVRSNAARALRQRSAQRVTG
jgi:hypothetical protein